MSDPNVEAKIVVHATPTKPQIAALLRQIVLVVGPVITLLSGMIFFKNFEIVRYWALFTNNLDGIATFVAGVASVVSFLWGQYETRKNAKKAAALAISSPIGDVK